LGSGGAGAAAVDRDGDGDGDGEDEEEWTSLDAMRSPNAIDACCASLLFSSPRRQSHHEVGKLARSPTSIESGQRGESGVGSQVVGVGGLGGDWWGRGLGLGFGCGWEERERGTGSGVSMRERGKERATRHQREETRRETDGEKKIKLFITIKSGNGNCLLSFLPVFFTSFGGSERARGRALLLAFPPI